MQNRIYTGETLVMPEFGYGEFIVSRHEFYILLCDFTICILISNIVAETAYGTTGYCSG
jgi:hypothetical protein